MKRFLGILLAVLLVSVCLYGAAEMEGIVEKIELSATELIVYTGKTARLKAEVEPAKAANRRVTWESSNPEVATVTNGSISGKSAGECDVFCSAADGSGVQAVCHVEVRIPVKSVKINEKNVTLLVGAGDSAAESQLTFTVQPDNAFFKSGQWKSSKEDVVSVDENGQLHALKAGNAVITFTSDDPNGQKKAQVNVKVVQAVTSVAFENDTVNVPVGKTQTLKAAVQPAGAANKKLNWTSSDESIVKVTNNGRIQGVATGTAVITATAQDGSGVAAECSVTVVQPVKKIEVSSKKIDLAPKTAWKVDFSAQPEDATIRGIEWKSSKESVAMVDSNGIIYGLAPGSCKITGTAVDGSGTKVQIDVKVQNYEVVIMTPGAVSVDFATTGSMSQAGITIGRMFYGETYETAISIRNGCVEGQSGNKLNPVKAGADKITITEKHNGRKVRSETHTVYVAQSAVDGVN